MTKMTKIIDLVNKTHELRQRSTGEYRKFQEAYRQDLTSIQQNKDYTPEGKQKLITSLKKQKTIEFLQGSRSYRQAYNGFLQDAKKLALDLIYEKTPKVEEETLERFTRDFQELKTEIKLSPAKTGKEKLESFLQTMKEPGLVEMVKNDFSEIIQPILDDAGKDFGQFRSDLLKAYEDVKVRSMDPEARNAMEIVEYADVALNGKFFSLSVERAVEENLGQTAKEYMHKPEEYFAENPEEDKPLVPAGMKTVEQIIEEENAKA